MAGMEDFTDDLFAQIQENNKTLAGSSDSVKQILAEQKQAQLDEIAALQTKKDNDAIVLKARELADLKAQDQVSKRSTELGIKPDESSDIITQLSSAWQTSAKDAIAKTNKLKDDMAIKFLEHPVDYVIANINLEDTAKEADASVRQVGTLQNMLAFTNTQTQQNVVTANAIKETRSAATVQATLESAGAAVDAQIAQTKIRNAGLNIGGILNLDTITAQQLNNLSTAVSVKNQAAQLDIAKSHLTLSKKQFELTLAEWNDKKEIRDSDRAEMEGLANLMRKGASAAGFEGAAQIPTAKALQMLKLKDPAYMKYLQIGMQSEALQHPVISENAGDTAHFIAQTGAPLQPAQEGIRKFLQGVWGEASRGANVIGPDGKLLPYDPHKPDQVAGATTVIANMRAVDQRNNVKTGDGTNIYAAPPLEALTSIPAIANSEWFKKVLSVPMSAGGLKDFNPEQLLALTSKAIQENKIDYKNASYGLQTLMAAVPVVNNRTKNYIGLGLPPATGYTTDINMGGLGVTKRMDLTQARNIDAILNFKLQKFSIPMFPSPWEKN